MLGQCQIQLKIVLSPNTTTCLCCTTSYFTESGFSELIVQCCTWRIRIMYIHPSESVLSAPVLFMLVLVFCLLSHLSLTSFNLHSFAVAKRQRLSRHVVKPQLVEDGVWAAVLPSSGSEYCSKHSMPAVASVFPHTLIPHGAFPLQTSRGSQLEFYQALLFFSFFFFNQSQQSEEGRTCALA